VYYYTPTKGSPGWGISICLNWPLLVYQLQLGAVLYNVLTTKLAPEYIEAEMNRYIPETIQKTASTSMLFKQYFYDVVLYKDRKPGIYTEFDEHMERVLNMEFFKRIIVKYLKE
jgi:hypothetical protein